MKKVLIFFSALLIVFFIGCNESDEGKGNQDLSPKESKNNEPNKDNVNKDGDDEGNGDYGGFIKGMKNLEDMMKKGKDVEVVNFRKLKEFLPEEINGMKRISSTGEKTSNFGMKVSQSEGKYKSEDGNQNITITITDLGSMKGFASRAVFAWAFAEIDKETETGYERTTKYSGHKAFERYDTESKRGSIDVFVGERFMVETDGYNVPMELIQSAVGMVPLGELENMKGEGVKIDE